MLFVFFLNILIINFVKPSIKLGEYFCSIGVNEKIVYSILAIILVEIYKIIMQRLKLLKFSNILLLSILLSPNSINLDEYLSLIEARSTLGEEIAEKSQLYFPVRPNVHTNPKPELFENDDVTTIK